MFRLIPVIDLKGGRVVHARRGARDTYAPIRSSLAPGAQPVGIAAALLQLHPFETLYLADIDAIQRQGDNLGAIEAIHAAFPAVELWVDAGIADVAGYSAWQTEHLGRAVIGTECMPDAALIELLHSDDHASVPVLSLDFGATGPLGSPEPFDHPEAWPQDVIVMTLTRVGSGAGPDATTLAATIGRAGSRRVYAAGGIRGTDDLALVRRLGAAGALVASSLHDGRLGAADLGRIAASAAPDR